MAEIIFMDAICRECEKALPKFSIAVVVEPEFIVCVECNENVEEGWRLMKEFLTESGHQQVQNDPAAVVESHQRGDEFPENTGR